MNTQQLVTLAEKGLFLKERLDGKDITFIEDTNTEIQNKRFEQWMNKVRGAADEEKFYNRLAAEDISVKNAKAALGEIQWKDPDNLPKWVMQIKEIMSLLPVSKEDMYRKMLFDSENDAIENNDMIDGVIPFAYYAEQQLLNCLGERKNLFSPKALSNMSKQLIEVITLICFQAYSMENKVDLTSKNPFAILFGTPISSQDIRENWDILIDKQLQGDWVNTIMKYPVLGRLMTISINQWVNGFSEFAKYLENDMEQLQRVFGNEKKLGKVIHIKGDNSDRHNEGKSVQIITFESGVKVVYKPRSLDVDQAFEGFTDWCLEKGFPYAIKSPKLIQGPNYGWVEFIVYLPVENEKQAEVFYEKAGALLAIVYVLGGNDFHYENMIACGENPVLIDIETILIPEVQLFSDAMSGEESTDQAMDILSTSVFRTGMLPMWQKKGAEVADWGGLTGGDYLNANIPMLKGKRLDTPAYEKSILKGFKTAYEFINDHKEALMQESSPLHLFDQCRCRYLIRQTQTYQDVIEHTLRPQYLQEGITFSIEIERMSLAYLLNTSGQVLKKIFPIFLSERDALERRDVPIFYGIGNELALIDHKENVYDGYFKTTAVNRAKSMVERLNKKDADFQLDLIKASLEIIEAKEHTPDQDEIASYRINKDVKPLSKSELLEEATSIYNKIIDKRVQAKDESHTWIVRQFNVMTEKLELGQIGISLYDGIMGIGTFMAALYKCTQIQDIKEKALNTIKVFRKDIYDDYFMAGMQRMPLGFGMGVGGIIKGLLLMAEYLDEPSLVEDAKRLAYHIQIEQIETDELLDVIGGSAGLVWALDDLYQIAPEERLLSLACEVGNNILKRRVKAESGHLVWQLDLANRPLTGLGHGAAGIADALLKIYGMTDDKRFYEGALEAIEYEKTCYDSKYNNWPDYRKNPDLEKDELVFMAGWCSGAPGVGLARLDARDIKIPDILEDIERAVEFSRHYPQHNHDHLCCGNTGRIDLLIEAGLALGKDELRLEATQKLSEIIERKNRLEHYRFSTGNNEAIFNPSLFQGLSGVGYEILRAIDPSNIHSVLR